MYIALIVLIGIIGLMLALVVLLQSGKGGGLAGIAAGGATTQILGARQAPDFLEKATWLLAALFMSLCVLTNFVIESPDAAESVIQQRTQEAPAQQPAPVLPPPTQAPTPETPAP